jgi:galactokinase
MNKTIQSKIDALHSEIALVKEKLEKSESRRALLEQRVVSLTELLVQNEASSQKEGELREVMVASLQAHQELQSAWTIVITRATELIEEKTRVNRAMGLIWRKWQAESLEALSDTKRI